MTRTHNPLDLLRQSPRTWLPQFIVALALLVVLLAEARAALLFLTQDGRAVSFPYPLDYGEGPLLDQAVRLSRFENIYHANFVLPPFVITNYPPLLVVAQTPFVWLFGPAFWYGRAISMLSVIAAAVFVALTLHAITRERLAAVVGALLLPAIPYVLFWAPLCRVDSLALGLSWAGLWVITRWTGRPRALVTAALLLAAAAFTRQSYALAAPFAALVWLWSQHSWRSALVFAGLLATIAAVVCIVLVLLTHNGFFFNTVTANVNAFAWGEVRKYMSEMIHFMPVLLAGSLLFGLTAWRWQVTSWWLVTPYLFGAVLSALTIGKIGSNVNYLFELSAAFSLALGALVATQRRWWLRVLLLLLVAWQTNLLLRLSRQDYAPRLSDKIELRVIIDEVAQTVHEAQGPVLADEYMGLLPLDHRPLYIAPFEMTQLARAGIWNQQPLLDAINHKEFGAILIFHLPDYPLEKDRWTAEALTAVDANYDLFRIVANTWIYHRRP
ncbi:MAG: hypothetical protein H0X37_24400 [Herpetosiphonaceae bacterium]|nr:hypothetical protein [Herpetosiphonaceae bacterium]